MCSIHVKFRNPSKSIKDINSRSQTSGSKCKSNEKFVYALKIVTFFSKFGYCLRTACECLSSVTKVYCDKTTDAMITRCHWIIGQCLKDFSVVTDSCLIFYQSSTGFRLACEFDVKSGFQLVENLYWTSFMLVRNLVAVDKPDQCSVALTKRKSPIRPPTYDTNNG